MEILKVGVAEHQLGERYERDTEIEDPKKEQIVLIEEE